jgi:3-oxoacyl-[acyl-carrier protein] reductase
MDVRLDGRRALITGGSQGLGLAMAKRFADSGGSVAILARRQDVLDKAKAAIEAGADGGAVAAISCDVSDAAALEEGWRAAVSAIGDIDILVNNAGSSVRGSFEEITDEMWQTDFDLKLFAAIRLSRLVLPGMKERRWGRILNILNIGARAPSAMGAPTQVTRAAGLALTKVLAGDGAPHNVLANALLTGTIATEQVKRRHQRNAPGQPLEDYIATEGERVPLGRMGTAEEYANMACFLASEQASYITGTAVNIDGNLSPVI